MQKFHSILILLTSDYEQGPEVKGEKYGERCRTNSGWRQCVCSKGAKGNPKDCGGGKDRKERKDCYMHQPGTTPTVPTPEICLDPETTTKG